MSFGALAHWINSPFVLKCCPLASKQTYKIHEDFPVGHSGATETNGILSRRETTVADEVINCLFEMLFI